MSIKYILYNKYSQEIIGYATIFKEHERDAVQVNNLEKSNLEFRAVEETITTESDQNESGESAAIVEKDLEMSEDSDSSCDDDQDSEPQSESSDDSSDDDNNNILNGDDDDDITVEHETTSYSLVSDPSSLDVCKQSERSRPSTSTSFISEASNCGENERSSCSKKLVTASDFMKVDPNNQRSVLCKLCLLGGKETLMSRRNFARHIRNVHESRPKVPCKFCNKEYAFSNIKHHEKTCENSSAWKSIHLNEVN